MDRLHENRPGLRAASYGFAVFALVLAFQPAFAKTPDTAATWLARVVNPELTTGLTVPGSGVLLLAGSDGTILRSTGGSRWSHATTPTSADLARLAANDRGTTLVAVGARGTVLRSVDAGGTWQAARNAVVDTDLKTVTFHAPSGVWLAAGTNGRLLRSKDDARSFSEIATNLTLDFHALFVDPETRNILIGGDQGATGWSNDAGESWQLTMIAMPEPATPVTAFHRFGKLLLATSALGRFLTSTDGAHSWDLLQSSSKSFFTDAAADPSRGAIVLTGHNGDVVRSGDGGEHWDALEVAPANKSFLAALSYDPRSESLLAVTQNGSLVRSRDGGATWSKAAPDLGGEIRGLLAAQDGRLITFGTGGRVATSPDSGASWQIARPGIDAQLREVVALGGGRFVATGQLGAILRSSDRGESWESIDVAWPDPNTPPDLRAVADAPDGGIVAAGPPGAILRADSAGTHWEVVHWTKLEDERAFPQLLSDRNLKRVIVVEARGEMRVARDGVREWQPVAVPGEWRDFPFWHASSLPDPDVVLITGKGGLAVRSDDGARRFHIVDTGTKADLYGSFADPDSRQMLLVGQDGTLLRSNDLGRSWQRADSGTRAELRRAWRDPRTGAYVVFGAHGAITRSTDGGRTWSVVPSGTDGVLRKAIHATRATGLLIVGGQGTLLRSRDGGASFERLETHTTRHFTSLAADPHSGDLVLVGERIVRLVRQSAR
jgi:photosystem II stability/assembly factor-like uncharacterized protein